MSEQSPLLASLGCRTRYWWVNFAEPIPKAINYKKLYSSHVIIEYVENSYTDFMLISILKSPSVTLSVWSPSVWSLMFQNVTWCVTHQYIGYGWRNSPQSFFEWKIWTLTTNWNPLEFLISNPGVRNVLWSQEGFLIFSKNKYSICQCFLMF